MPLSQDILSLEPREVDQAVLEFFRASVGAKEIETTHEALMHRVAHYIYLANEKKTAKVAKEIEQRTNLSRLIRSSTTAGDLAVQLEQHVFTPAFTAHPTNPKSAETDEVLTDIYNIFMLIRNEMAAGKRDDAKQAEKNQIIREKLVSLGLVEVPLLGGDVIRDRNHLLAIAHEDLEVLCQKLSEMKLQPEQKLTVEQEVKRNLEVFSVAFGEFNKFKRRVIEEYCQSHADVDRVEVARILTPAIARQFQEIHFWSGSDADGNDKITHQTMFDAVIEHQKFLDELYLAEIEKIKYLFIGHDIALRGLFAIKEIIEEVEAKETGGEVEEEKDSKKIVERIDALIAEATKLENGSLTPVQRQALDDLRDSFECFGFVGPKMDVRQSSFRNVVSMNQILQYLRTIPDIDVSQFHGEYQNLDAAAQKAFCEKLKEPAILEILSREETLKAITAVAKANAGDDATLKKQADIAEQEIRRMVVAKQYPDTFHRYIISDNKGIQSWNEVRALEAIAYKIANPQKQEVDKRPLQIYPLCETRTDIDNLPDMIRRLLDDSSAVATLHGRLDLFIGYHDAEKRAGIGALALLQQRVNEAIQIVNDHNSRVPEEQRLRVEIFHGRGNDLIRGGDKLSKITTDQGQGAIDFKFKQRFKMSLELRLAI